MQCSIKCHKCNTGPAPRRAPFGGDRRWGVPGRLGERRNGKALAIAALALVLTAGLLAAQPGGWIGAPSGDGEAAVPDAWPPSGDAAFAWLLPGYAFAQSVALNLTAAGSITDTTTLELDGAAGIATFTSGGSTYAAVASYYDDGVQILNITDPSNVTAAGSITDTPTLKLDGAWGIATFESDSRAYAAVASYYDDGVQILDITDPSNVTAAGSIGNTDALELDGARGIAVFESGGSTYAAVASLTDNGVQILNITNPSNVTAAGSITDTPTLKLDGAWGIATFRSGGSTYAAVTAYDDSGVQILNVTNPSNVTAAGSIGNTDALVLGGAEGIATFTSGGSTYAAVASLTDNGVQILNITNPSNVTAAGSITNTPTLKLDGAWGIATFRSGGSTYAAVTAYDDSGVQILNVTNPSNVTAAGSIGNTDALVLGGAEGIATFTSGGSAYAAVAAYDDDGVQILRLTNSPPVVGAGADQEAAEGSTVTLDGTASDTDTEDTLTYAWSHNSTLSFALDDDSAPDPSFTAPNVSEDTVVEFTLAVSDGMATVSDKALVTILDSANSAPSPDAGADQEAAEGATVSLSGTATDGDPEDTPTYSWTHDGAPSITITGSDSASASFTAPNVAANTTITVTLTVNDGTVDASDTLQVTITDSPNRPPTVNAGQDQEVAEGATVSLSGTATDGDPEDTPTYSWTHDGAPSITITGSDSASASFTAPNVAANTTITVTLTVNDGTVDASDTLQVTITDSPNRPPTVNAGQDQEVAEGATVSLSGTATDGDPEDTPTYSWTHDGAPSITITGSDSASASFTAPNVAANTTITVTLTVTT